MSKQHKWHKEIKHWADGGEVQFYDPVTETWELIEEPLWWDRTEYRIKPQPKEPQYLYVYADKGGDVSALTKREGKYNEDAYIGKIKLEIDD